MANATIEDALLDITQQLTRLRVPCALVGGLAVSIRAEVRFTRDVDVAVVVSDDAHTEWLVRELRMVRYSPVTLVEHDERHRIATVRLRSPSGFVVDLLGATCGIEAEIVARATLISIGTIGDVRVARAEELLAMKVLSMSERRLQDTIDARNLLEELDAVALEAVTENLKMVTARGYGRGQDLLAKLDALVAANRDSDQ